MFVSFLHVLVTNHFLFINCLFLGRANDKAFSSKDSENILCKLKG